MVCIFNKLDSKNVFFLLKNKSVVHCVGRKKSKKVRSWTLNASTACVPHREKQEKYLEKHLKNTFKSHNIRKSPNIQAINTLLTFFWDAIVGRKNVFFSVHERRTHDSGLRPRNTVEKHLKKHYT